MEDKRNSILNAIAYTNENPCGWFWGEMENGEGRAKAFRVRCFKLSFIARGAENGRADVATLVSALD